MGIRQKLGAFIAGRPAIFFESFKSQAGTKSELDLNLGRFDFMKYCEKYERYKQDYPKVKSALLTVSGQVMAEGVFTIPAERTDNKTGKTEKYPRAIEAKLEVDKLNEKINLDGIIQMTAQRMVHYGTAFLEKTYTPEFSVRPVVPKYQKYMMPRWNKELGVLDGWDLKIRNEVKASWKNNEIIVVPWDVDVHYPFGTSLLEGIDRELSISDNILAGLEKYVKRQAWATHMVQVGDPTYTPGDTELNAFRTQVRRGEVGQTIITNAPISKETLGAGDVETQMIPDILAFEDDQIADSLMMPPLSKLYNSTQASSVEMTDWARANLITPIQRIIQRKVEEELFWAYLEPLGYSKRVVPKLSFNPPEAGRLDEAKYWSELVVAKIASPKQAASDLGMDYDEAYWKEQEALMLKHQQADKNAVQPKKPEAPSVDKESTTPES